MICSINLVIGDASAPYIAKQLKEKSEPSWVMSIYLFTSTRQNRLVRIFTMHLRLPS